MPYQFRLKVLFFIFLLLSFNSTGFAIQESYYKKAFEDSGKNKKQKNKKAKTTNKNKNTKNSKDIFLESDYDKFYTVDAAKYFLSNFEYSRAFVILKKLLNKNPQDKEINFLLGRIYSYSREYRKASFYFLKGSDYYLDSSSGYDYGVSFYMIKDYPRAVKGFRKVAEDSVLKNIVNFYIGVCYLEMNKLPLALIYFNSAENLPENYKAIQEKYIQYIESNINKYDQKLYKKRVRKITRKELPDMPKIKKDTSNNSYDIEYDSKPHRSKKDQEPRVFEITPFFDQSINSSSYEYSTEVLSSVFYKYQGGLKLKLEPVFSSGKKRGGVEFSIPSNLDVNSFGIVMFSSDIPNNSQLSESLTKAPDGYFYESSSDFKRNSFLSLKLAPRLEVSMGSLSNIWVEYDYSYNILGFEPNNADYTHEVWVGAGNLGSSSVYVDISGGLESFLAQNYDVSTNVITSNLSLVFKLNTSNKIILATNFYYGLEKENITDTDNYKFCLYNASSEYICDGVNSDIDLSYELSNSYVSLGVKVNYSLPVGEEKRVEASSVSFNTNFKYIGSRYFSLYMNLAFSNITLDTSVYELDPGISFSPVSGLYFNIDTAFKYLTKYEYKLYSSSFDSYQNKKTEEGGFSISASPSISYEPLKWLKLGLKCEYVYNEYSIPEEDEDSVYFWHPDKNIGADYSHYNLVFNVNLAYSF